MVLALIVTPEGFPLACAVMPGHTADKTTLKDCLAQIQPQYGRARRIWVMDGGIPPEEVLQQMRESEPPVLYAVGTPKGRLTQLEQQWAALPWAQAREGVEVKLLAEAGAVSIYAQSRDRVNQERARHRRQMRGLRDRLQELARLKPQREALLMKLGARRERKAPQAWRRFAVSVGAAPRGPNPDISHSFS